MTISAQTLADGEWQSIEELSLTDEQRSWYQENRQSEQLNRVLTCSPAAAALIRRYPEWPLRIVNELHSFSEDYWFGALSEALAEAATLDEDPAQTFREFRNYHWLRIVWRDLNRLADTAETTLDLSLMAEACIQQGQQLLHNELKEKWGEPHCKQNRPQQMVVIAMGKLGARELNLSSDIDLIFTYPEGGSTKGGRREIDNQEFFIRLGQKLIKLLDLQTAHGFVFRVDMRLRPYGQSGPLVMSFDALEEYYQNQGREWERYALIKARTIAGNPEDGEQLLELLRPFVYRSYVDFSVIEALRGMKSLIMREMERRKLHNDVKLGPGGIREIEFIAQCFQLIRGGQEPQLQRRRLMGVMAALKESEALPDTVVDELSDAYHFLRDTEHAIQAWGDAQTQKLPIENEAKLALAHAMGFADWKHFFEVLEEKRLTVARHFADVIADPDHEASGLTISEWSRELDEPTEASLLLAFDREHFENSEESARRLSQFIASANVDRMQTESRARLDSFLPCLLEAVVTTEQPSLALERTLPLVESVLRRTAYLSLLIENPAALQRLVTLCAASPWIAKELATHPVLLDEFLNADTLYHPADKSELQSELYQHLLRVQEDDLEAQMNTLRYFKLSHNLRVAAAEINGTLPLMKVSDYLSNIAEVVCSAVLDLAWRQMAQKYGEPAVAETGSRPFVIVAYGKLGGIELSYGSDLDLVFLHDALPGGNTDGAKAVDNGMFMVRLGQRMIHILTTRTHLGQLYEADMRLRPNGESGLLACSFSAFEKYQQETAWVWEHQALVRARVIAGDQNLAEKVEKCRAAVLKKHRETEALRAEVVTMREKMRDHLRPKDTETENHPEFDLKHGSGAIVDIEFMVQYAVLIWSREHPSLSRYTDNIRLLESLREVGVLSKPESEGLIDAYKVFRSHGHRLALQQQKARLPLSELQLERHHVRAMWAKLMQV